MDYLRLSEDDKTEIIERYELAIHRIREISEEEDVRAPLRDYFQRVARFIILIDNVAGMIKSGTYDKLSIVELKSINRSLYEDIIGANYDMSYANPSYACKSLGVKYGKLLSFLYTELRSTIIYAFEEQIVLHTMYLELFLQVYGLVRWEDDFTPKDVKRAIGDFMLDNCEVLTKQRTLETADPSYSFGRKIIMKSNLKDLSYLYKYGDYISDNELKTAEYINSLNEEHIVQMAATFTLGYERGFAANGLDLSQKNNVNIRYQIGFERVVRQAIHNFKEMGLDSIIYRAAYLAIHKKQHLKIGYHGSSPNKQYDYDHRFDIGIFLNKELNNRRLEALHSSLKPIKDITQRHGGPAVMEVFGEELFSPLDKPEAIRLTKRQQKLNTEYYSEVRLINKEYFKTHETSFTIISYPIAEIGPDFEDIFEATVKVNTLDNELYKSIQQNIIDALDKGEFIRVLGKGKNLTDMRVRLQPLADPSKETNFENCVADVNIPVGEVFTSPMLTGTHGVLHVPLVYLNDLAYHDLELVFEDGQVIDYSCKNYDDVNRNKEFIRENLLYNHESLPLGEFAIGTNTTAYMMGKKYDIAPKLPILIAEKTGPHFAIGDTCYSMREDLRVYNPDGKEIIARDNEITLVRNTNPKGAYFNCHTDITLPYDEIKEISVVLHDGATIPIIEDSRFVLEGTALLNQAFDLF